MKQTVAWVISSLTTITGIITPSLALNTSTGEAGIYANRLHQQPLNLTGRKIAIGQVEIGRPG
ncbi:MAG: peptidase S8 and S53 subtilisin kexin sedolisin, partial [Crocosphaera sp.]